MISLSLYSFLLLFLIYRIIPSTSHCQFMIFKVGWEVPPFMYMIVPMLESLLSPLNSFLLSEKWNVRYKCFIILSFFLNFLLNILPCNQKNIFKKYIINKYIENGFINFNGFIPASIFILISFSI